MARISTRLLEIGKTNSTGNLYDKIVLPRVPINTSQFNLQLSEYGASLTNYIVVLKRAKELHLAVYCAKTGSNKFVRIDEEFNPVNYL